jgi:hypothetical protein
MQQRSGDAVDEPRRSRLEPILSMLNLVGAQRAAQ